MRFIFTLCALVVLAACSQSGQKSKVEVTTSFAFGGANMAAFSEGGLMVWGRSDKGHSFGRVLTDSDSISLDLDNATWTFTAVAWDNTSSVELDATKLRCARSTSLALTGSPVNLNLQLTEANCQVPLFKASATDALKLTQLRFCRSTSLVSGPTDECNQSWANPSWKDYKAPVMSLRLRLVAYDRSGAILTKLPSTLSSTCVTVDGATGTWNTPGNLMLPVGDPANPLQGDFATELELHLDTNNCTDATPVVKTYAHGIAAGTAGSKYFTVNTGTLHRVFVELKDSEVCALKGSAVPFAGGDGNTGFPYLICSAQQLYNLASGDLSKSYRLMRDIDLNPYTQGLTHSLTLPANAANCWRPGQNWQPVGYALDGGCTVTLTPFTGNFVGGGYELKHLRTFFDEEPYVGFIAKWTPNTAGYVLRDLSLAKAEVEGRDKVGALLGGRSGANAAAIHNIKIVDAEVRARKDSGVSAVGGLAGELNDTSLEDIRVSGSKIRGEGNSIGGVVGMAFDLTRAKYLFIKQSIVAMDSSTAAKVGGIFGYFDATSSLDTDGFGVWSSDAGVVGTSQVGGLIGEWVSANQPLTAVYSTSAVSGRGYQSSKIGGLFGEAPASSAQLLQAYFAGSVVNYPLDPTCGGTCDVGLVSGYDDGAVISLTNVYVMAQGSQMSEGDGDSGYAYTGRTNTPASGSLFNLVATTNLSSPEWVRHEGDLPRLVKEQHPCSSDADADGIDPRDSLGVQKTKWGTAKKPLKVCRIDQFLELSSHLGENKFAELVGGVNLGSAVAHTPVTITSGATLSGKNGYLQGLRNLAVADGVQMAPFASIDGTLADVKIANLVLHASAVSATTTLSGIAHTNNGVIERVQFVSGKLSHADPLDVQVAGLVHTNQTNKVLRDGVVSGILAGPASIAGVSWNNAGVIERVRAGAEIRVPTSFENFAGIANLNLNTGRIQAVEMTSRLSYGSIPLGTSVSMGVLSNQGLLLDTAISSEAQWNFNFHATTGNVVQLALANTGTIKRAVVGGELFDQERFSSSFTLNRAKLVGTDTGTTQGVFAVPTGRQIVRLDTVNVVSCSSNVLTFNGNAQLDVTSTVFDLPFFDSDLLADNDAGGPDVPKVVWLKLRNNDEERWVHATGGTLSSGKIASLTLGDSCTNLGLPGAWNNITVVHAPQSSLSAALGDLSTSPFNGFSTAGAPFDDLLSASGSPWLEDIAGAPVADSVVADTSEVGPGLDWVIDYYLAILTGQTPPPAPIWEIDDEERLELFEVSK